MNTLSSMQPLLLLSCTLTPFSKGIYPDTNIEGSAPPPPSIAFFFLFRVATYDATFVFLLLVYDQQINKTKRNRTGFKVIVLLSQCLSCNSVFQSWFLLLVIDDVHATLQTLRVFAIKPIYRENVIKIRLITNQKTN